MLTNRDFLGTRDPYSILPIRSIQSISGRSAPSALLQRNPEWGFLKPVDRLDIHGLPVQNKKR